MDLDKGKRLLLITRSKMQSNYKGVPRPCDPLPSSFPAFRPFTLLLPDVIRDFTHVTFINLGINTLGSNYLNLCFKYFPPEKKESSLSRSFRPSKIRVINYKGYTAELALVNKTHLHKHIFNAGILRKNRREYFSSRKIFSLPFFFFLNVLLR